MLFSFLLWMRGVIRTITPKQKYWFWLLHALYFPINVVRTVKKYFFFFLCDGIHQSSQDLKLNSWCVKVNDQDQFSPRKSWITRAQQNHSVWFKSVFKKSEKISLQYEVLCNLKWSFQTKKLISLQKKKKCFLLFHLITEWVVYV